MFALMNSIFDIKKNYENYFIFKLALNIRKVAHGLVFKTVKTILLTNVCKAHG